MPVAIIRRRPDRDELLIEHKLETFHHKLVRSGHHLHIIAMAVLCTNIRAKHVTSAARIDTPARQRSACVRLEEAVAIGISVAGLEMGYVACALTSQRFRPGHSKGGHTSGPRVVLPAVY